MSADWMTDNLGFGGGQIAPCNYLPSSLATLWIFRSQKKARQCRHSERKGWLQVSTALQPIALFLSFLGSQRCIPRNVGKHQRELQIRRVSRQSHSRFVLALQVRQTADLESTCSHQPR